MAVWEWERREKGSRPVEAEGLREGSSPRERRETASNETAFTVTPSLDNALRPRVGRRLTTATKENRNGKWHRRGARGSSQQGRRASRKSDSVPSSFPAPPEPHSATCVQSPHRLLRASQSLRGPPLHLHVWLGPSRWSLGKGRYSLVPEKV